MFILELKEKIKKRFTVYSVIIVSVLFLIMILSEVYWEGSVRGLKTERVEPTP